MSNYAYFLCGTERELKVWQSGAAVPVEGLSDDDWDRAAGAPWVIEGSTGPLAQKQVRLRRLAEVGVKTVLTASTTALIAAQRVWIPDGPALVGYDPLLALAGGTVQTVVTENRDEVEILSRMWPERRFVAVKDAIGLVFSREILPIINEAVAFFEQGVRPEDIDRGVRLGLNYPKGPLEWADLFGWPSVYWGLRALEDMFGPRFRPHPWIRAQVGSSLVERERD